MDNTRPYIDIVNELMEQAEQTMNMELINAIVNDATIVASLERLYARTDSVPHPMLDD